MIGLGSAQIASPMHECAEVGEGTSQLATVRKISLFNPQCTQIVPLGIFQVTSILEQDSKVLKDCRSLKTVGGQPPRNSQGSC